MSVTKKSLLQITGLYSLYLPVRQVERSATWYIKHFGLQLVERKEKSISLRLGHAPIITLVESEQMNVYDSPPFSLKAHDARKAYAQLDKDEVQANEPESWLHYVEFNVWDPDGNLINIISDPAWPNTPNNYFDINGLFLGVVDFAQTFSWVTNLIGDDIEYDFTMPTTSMAEARCVCFRNIQFSIFDSPGSVIRYKVADFKTDNIEYDYNSLKDMGVKVTEITEDFQKKSLSFWDLNGIEIGLVELK